MLEADPGWSVFALADLADPYFERCTWFGTESGRGLAMVYRGFDPPVLFAMGDAGGLLDEIDAPVLYLHVPNTLLPGLRRRFREAAPKPMWRMVLDPARYRPERGFAVEPLGVESLDGLRRLYADGDATGEAPGFFQPEMLAGGSFFGIREGGDWIAAGGTQVLARAEGVAAIGNIYTRRDRRGGGLAGAVTTAVTDELLGRGIPTIALNVSQSNAAAVRVYERLGFVRHCGYLEGTARR